MISLCHDFYDIHPFPHSIFRVEVASPVHFVRLKTGGQVVARKVVLLR
jgi:hypothetical protein